MDSKTQEKVFKRVIKICRKILRTIRPRLCKTINRVTNVMVNTRLRKKGSGINTNNESTC